MPVVVVAELRPRRVWYQQRGELAFRRREDEPGGFPGGRRSASGTDDAGHRMLCDYGFSPIDQACSFEGGGRRADAAAVLL